MTYTENPSVAGAISGSGTNFSGANAHQNGIGLVLIQDGEKPRDVSQLVKKVRWSGRRGAACRTLSVEFLDDGTNGRPRAEIDVEEGHQCIFSYNGEELFRGMFMQQRQTTKKALTAVAYDNGIYLTKNKDTFNYANMTASQIFVDVCNRFGIPVGSVADTAYIIPELPKPKTTGYDVIADALSITYKAQGIRYFPICIGDEMCLLERRDFIKPWVIETGANLTDYDFTKSTENVKTRILMLSKEGECLASAVDGALEQKLGVFQDVVQAEDGQNDAQLNETVQTVLAENNIPERNLTVKALGITDAMTGVGLYCRVGELGPGKCYYIEQDSHDFEGRKHMMSLGLVVVDDVGKVKTTGSTTTTSRGGGASSFAIGDVVNFTGGNHYVASTATSPVGGSRSAGPAKLTHIARGNAHPYHVIGGAYTSVDGNSNVYGWVDENQITG